MTRVPEGRVEDGASKPSPAMAPSIKELVIARQAPLLGQLSLHWIMSVHGATFAHVVTAAEMAHHITAVPRPSPRQSTSPASCRS